MNRLFLISALCAGLVGRGYAQPITVWIEQLAALQTLQHTIQQGYTTVAYGLDSIGGIRTQEYGLHEGYFSSLNAVKPVIAEDPRVQAMRSRLAALLEQLRAALDYWQNQPIRSP